eukprot:Sdes_comp24122_c0_seq1m22163
MADWRPSRSLNNNSINYNIPAGVTCLTTDTYEELVWVGTEFGQVSSYLHQRQLEKYVSLRAHLREIRHILPFQNSLASLSSNNIRIFSRQGIPSCTINNDSFYDLHCMTSIHQNDNLIIVGGNQP